MAPDLQLLALGAVLIAALLGAGLGFLAARQHGRSPAAPDEWRGRAEALDRDRAAAAARAAELERSAALLREERDRLQERLQTASAELAAARQKTDDLAASADRERAAFEESRRLLKTEFENLAAQILEDKSRRFTEQNKAQIEQMLQPLGERIQEFRRKVETAYDTENRERAALAEKVRQLTELNQQVSREAHNLTQALKGHSKVRGNWGEMLLESVLEQCGLVRGQDFLTQVSIGTEDRRRLQPDVILQLPGKRHLVVDAKVSLTAYERHCSAADPAEKEAAAREHAASLRRHIEQLGGKAYAGLPGLLSPDFVMLFVPIEPALHLALETEPGLLELALRHNIVLVTAPSLLATARLVAQLWQQERQNRNAQQIAELGGRLYDKFSNFCGDLLKVGGSLDAAQKSYDEAMKKLRDGKGNLLRQSEKLRALGAKASAKLPHALLPDAAPPDEEETADEEAEA